MAGVRPSAVSSILRAATQPDIISFAGGLPAMDLFPVEALRAAAERVLADQGAAALQYGHTVGFDPLREWVANDMRRRGVDCAVDNIILTSGAQQALDLVCRAYLEPGDVALVETPTYLTIIRVFQACEARIVSAPTDGQGVVVEALPALIERYRPKLLYTVPNFMNPSGVTLARERRPMLADLAARYGMIVVEDDPYGQIRFAGEELPPIKAFDAEGQVIFTGTFSKTIAPGLRIGWAVIEPEMMETYVALKQVADTMSSTLDQRIAYAYLATGENSAHIQRIRAVYRERFAAMDAALRTYMPEGFTWTRPEGGMFLWVTGPASLDTGELLKAALVRGVLFVPGADFYPEATPRNSLRLSYSAATPERIRKGIAILGEVCRQYLTG